MIDIFDSALTIKFNRYFIWWNKIEKSLRSSYKSTFIRIRSKNNWATFRWKTLAVPVAIGGDDLSSLVGIGLTDLPNIGGPVTSLTPGSGIPIYARVWSWFQIGNKTIVRLWLVIFKSTWCYDTKMGITMASGMISRMRFHHYWVWYLMIFFSHSDLKKSSRWHRCP